MKLEFIFAFKNFSEQKKNIFSKNICVSALFYNFDP